MPYEIVTIDGKSYVVDVAGGGNIPVSKLDVGADGVSNPVVGDGDGRLPVSSRGKLWNGTAWIDEPGDAANGADVDVTRSALPTGASTEAKQDAAQTRFDLLATEAKLEAVRALLAGTLTTGLPTGAATDTKSEAIRALLAGTLAVDSELSAAAALADGQALPTAGKVGAVPQLYNGATLDMERGNVSGTLLASGLRTAVATAPIQTNHNADGVALHLRITAASGTGGIGVRILEVDPVSGAGAHLLVSPLILATGIYHFVIHPGESSGPAGVLPGGTAHNVLRVAGSLGRTWYATVAHGDASDYTYSLGYSYR